MGWQSKATNAQHSNLGRPNNPHKPTVEDVSDDEDSDFGIDNQDGNLLEHGFFFLDEELSEEDLDGNRKE